MPFPLTPADPSFAIRGLAVDVEKGLLCKLSYIHQIAKRCVFRGRRKLSPEEVLQVYGGSSTCIHIYREKEIYMWMMCRKV